MTGCQNIKKCHDIISQQVRENFSDLYMNK